MNIIFVCGNTHTNISSMYSSSHNGSLGKSAYSGNRIPLTGPKVNGIIKSSAHVKIEGIAMSGAQMLEHLG